MCLVLYLIRMSSILFLGLLKVLDNLIELAIELSQSVFTLRIALTCRDANSVYPFASPTYFDIYIFKWKDANEASGAPALVDMQAFLEDDNTAKQYTGLQTDGLRRLNDSQFQLLAKKRITLSNFLTTGNSSGRFQNTNP